MTHRNLTNELFVFLQHQVGEDWISKLFHENISAKVRGIDYL